MKKIKLCITGILMMMLLSGCQSEVQLSEEETDMFAEYISNVVLQRDKYYDEALVKPEVTEDEQQEESKEQETVSSAQTVKPIQTSSSSTKTETTSVSKTSVDLSDLFGKNGVSVQFKSCKYYNSYPQEDNSYFTIESMDGYKLLVVKFQMKNTQSKAVKFNVLSDDVSYRLNLSDGSSYSPLMTLLVEDLQFMNTTINAGKSQEGVLVFRVSSEDAGKESSITLTKGSNCADVKLN